MSAHAEPNLDKTALIDPVCDGGPAVTLRPHRLAASFAAMADQIAVASQALVTVPPTADATGLREKMEGIERTQARILGELGGLRGQAGATETAGEAEAGGELAKRVEALEKKLGELTETVQLEQKRLPDRLHNARATYNRATLRAPATASGKPVAGFPTFRGEFEHITKERYEGLLKAYGLALKGDSNAKREALRVFAGIPEDGL